MLITTSDIIACPTRPDLSKKVYGDAITNDDLWYMRMRDDKVGFVIDVMTDDAHRNGWVYEKGKKPENADALERVIKQCHKWGRQLRNSIIIFLDKSTEDLNQAMGKAVGMFAMHPLVSSEGGYHVLKEDIDKKTGFPLRYHVIPFPGYKGADGSKDIVVDASRVELYTNGDLSRSWEGTCAVSRVYDDALGLRLLRGTQMRRARDYATIRYLIQLMGITKDPKTQMVPQDIITYFSNALKDVPHMLVAGEAKVDPIGGPVQPEELGIVVDQANKGSATGAGVATSDITGSEAGAKLSTDADQATYGMQIKDIQRDITAFGIRVFKRLGIKVSGMKSPSELPAEKKYEQLGKLLDMYNRSPPSIKDAVGQLITDFMSAEFNKEVVIDVGKDSDAAALDEEASGGTDGSPGEGSEENKEKRGWFKRQKK